MKRMVSFVWDNARDREYAGRNLIIGQHLPLSEDGYNESCVCVYGIGIHIPDPKKDLQLHHFSCHNSNLETNLEVISKEDARRILIAEIDLALSILFDLGNIEEADTLLNKSSEEVETGDKED